MRSALRGCRVPAWKELLPCPRPVSSEDGPASWLEGIGVWGLSVPRMPSGPPGQPFPQASHTGGGWPRPSPRDSGSGLSAASWDHTALAALSGTPNPRPVLHPSSPTQDPLGRRGLRAAACVSALRNLSSNLRSPPQRGLQGPLTPRPPSLSHFCCPLLLSGRGPTPPLPHHPGDLLRVATTLIQLCGQHCGKHRQARPRCAPGLPRDGAVVARHVAPVVTGCGGSPCAALCRSSPRTRASD